jgi:hypothetical protein
MKRAFKGFAFLAVIGSAVAGAYYYFFMMKKPPAVELYFDDGSMLALEGGSPEAASFMQAAEDILAKSPVAL